MMKLTPRDEERFWAKVLISAPDQCWEWTASLRKGYGAFKIGGRSEEAHKIAYLLEYEDPGNKWVLHRCDNRVCVNPRHLFLGDRSANMIDAVQKSRLTIQKLSPRQVEEIRNLIGLDTMENIGNLFGVSSRTVSNIHNCVTWSHV